MNTMLPDLPEEQGESSPRYVDVGVQGVVTGGRGGVFTYQLPDDIEAAPAVGQLVWVPVRNKSRPGIVVGFPEHEPDFRTLAINKIAEPPIRLTDQQFEMTIWMAHETVSPVFACASLFLPPGLTLKAIEVYRLNPDADPSVDDLTPLQQSVVDLLAEHGEMSLDGLRRRTGKPLTSVVPGLMERGLLVREYRPEQRTRHQRMVRLIRVLDASIEVPERAFRQRAVMDEIVQMARLQDGDEPIPVVSLQSQVAVESGVLDALVERGGIEVIEVPPGEAPEPRASLAPSLNPHQAAAWTRIERALNAQDSTPHVLFGVTGSGKTELYLRGVAWCLRHGKRAIVLVPEIALTAQIQRRFNDRFPDRVALLHSQLSQGERSDVWERIEAGEFDVVVGPRSALFTPVENLGLIVIDEEHDSSFKQDSEPRYHARTVAVELAHRTGAVVLLGSATPAIETMWKTEQGEWQLLELPERVGPVSGSRESQALELPSVEIVDLKAELREGNARMLSRALHRHVARSLANGEQSILLLNRRGTNTIAMCRSCSHRLECPNCDIPVIYHADRDQMICHRCDFRMPRVTDCPECGGRMDYFGAGTQRVEEEVRRTFPDARVMRWDADAIRTAGGYMHMLHQVESGNVDIIVGTQMVSKGFDLPLVTTIGVVQADSMLYLPDFRSSERTFQLLTQVAGRAGRRGPGSTVVFQSYAPENYAVQAASRHDYRAFYADEIDFRERFRFPPFLRLARFIVSRDKEDDAAMEAELQARELARHARAKGLDIELLGPTPAFVAKRANRYQWQIVMRTREMESMLERVPIRAGWIVDVDPESML